MSASKLASMHINLKTKSILYYKKKMLETNTIEYELADLESSLTQLYNEFCEKNSKKRVDFVEALKNDVLKNYKVEMRKVISFYYIIIVVDTMRKIEREKDKKNNFFLL
jgi:hypothetical protein